MEKKTRRSLTELAYNRETVIVELSNGLKWEAKLLPVSTLVDLTDGLLGESMTDVASVTVALTGGRYEAFPLETLQPTIALIASYGGDTSEIT